MLADAIFIPNQEPDKCCDVFFSFASIDSDKSVDVRKDAEAIERFLAREVFENVSKFMLGVPDSKLLTDRTRNRQLNEGIEIYLGDRQCR